MITTNSEAFIEKNSTNRVPFTNHVYTGEALGVVVDVNPSREDYIKYNNYEAFADKVEEPQYTGIVFNNDPDNTEYTKLEFWIKYNPAALSGDSSLPSEAYQAYPIYISNKPKLTASGYKVKVIDKYANRLHVPYDADKTARQMVEDTISDANTSENYARVLRNLDLDSVAICREGEDVLIDFMLRMSRVAKKSVEIESNPARWQQYMSGDVASIKEYMNGHLCSWTDGGRLKVGIMLGVKTYYTNDGRTKLYQEIYTNRHVCCIFRETSRPETIEMEGKKYHTRLSPDARKFFFGDFPGGRVWNYHWQDSFKFKTFDSSKLETPSTIIDDSASSATDDDDDLFG